ncbi:uncharacterized protein [Coffea arabica]|uniref:Uncharacterized protein isoform X1 n=1 Tax=Coffea arabica TaxID=13443 RepID=A0ABM4UM39_COFAR
MASPCEICTSLNMLSRVFMHRKEDRFCCLRAAAYFSCCGKRFFLSTGCCLFFLLRQKVFSVCELLPFFLTASKGFACCDLLLIFLAAAKADETPRDVDEIKEFQQGRWVSAPEALWRIYAFRLNEMTPAVYSLQVHLPDHQYVSFDQNSDLSQLLKNIDFSKTMLIEFFRMNRVNEKAQDLKYLYREFAEHFVWTPGKRKWTERSKQKVIGRLVTVKPSEGDRYYLRLLLSHVRAPTSFDDLLTVNGCRMNSFREIALHLGLLESDSYIEETLEEAVGFQMPSSLRFLFVTLLLHCAPTNPSLLWEKFEMKLSRDFELAQTHH